MQCYYTFVRGRNVCDSSGRAGSYFALTLKMNAFYADVQNIYNILKAVYDKMCVGLCIQEENGMVKYLLSDFQGIDGKLKEVEGHLLNYISKFSKSNDIVSLSGFAANGHAANQNLNLFECNKTIATEQMKKVGHLQVSPHYLSSESAKIVAQCKAETQAVMQKSQQEIQLLKKAAQEERSTMAKQAEERVESMIRKSQEDLKACQEQYSTRIAQTKEESDRRIAEIKSRYKDVDANIKSLEQIIKDRNKEISDLKSQCGKKDVENKKLQRQLDDAQSNNLINSRMPPIPSKQKKWKEIARYSFCFVLFVGIIFFTYYVVSSLNDIKKEIGKPKIRVEQTIPNAKGAPHNDRNE